MKKISLIIALALIISIGGVYATWTYTQSSDVMDVRKGTALNLTEATSIGTYGTYSINTDTLTMDIDPKAGTTHTTSLLINGEVVITFTPNTHAPADVKANGVDSTYTFSLSNADWKYDGQTIVELTHTEAHDIVWTKETDGTFTYTFDATALAEHIRLTEFNLDTKAKYDAYDAVLGQGQIVLAVSDGQHNAA